jgi:hypothetical protein
LGIGEWRSSGWSFKERRSKDTQASPPESFPGKKSLVALSLLSQRTELQESLGSVLQADHIAAQILQASFYRGEWHRMGTLTSCSDFSSFLWLVPASSDISLWYSGFDNHLLGKLNTSTLLSPAVVEPRVPGSWLGSKGSQWD